jgi:hypothetical protein
MDSQDPQRAADDLLRLDEKDRLVILTQLGDDWAPQGPRLENRCEVGRYVTYEAELSTGHEARYIVQETDKIIGIVRIR